eukprot:CAMPEP_0181248572 /NCGR_PEP_ID=MMETSP1096-20121128/45241_1 /TAXON_ID=156174 ORGANISM="Chrysochromulina ericina, Strain CCMP281" /NCGR_SAMPLE_ID=MMETSP1096 /ASSEMBLY_ACC=CAM_ASM_000453 /LENGTH=30 /DNA_ID= /DNA_START= /DNA_END= /DNA_ORIENTATION=
MPTGWSAILGMCRREAKEGSLGEVGCDEGA